MIKRSCGKVLRSPQQGKCGKFRILKQIICGDMVTNIHRGINGSRSANFL